jgi:divalent metal cation (Fe/Co/Zn/Cd) transporter
MSYGWRRTELLGGLSNGLFLLSMSTFIFLQAIPSFISPPSGKEKKKKSTVKQQLALRTRSSFRSVAPHCALP